MRLADANNLELDIEWWNAPYKKHHIKKENDNMKLSSEQIEIKKKIELEGIKNIINNAVSEDITNGDLVNAMFPNCNVEELGLYDYSLIDKESEAIILIAHKWWWNTSYKENKE